MVNIRKKQIKAYILWESVLSILVMMSLISLFVIPMLRYQKQFKGLEEKSNALSVAVMALQTQKKTLHLNGVHIKIIKIDNQVKVIENGETLLNVVQKKP